MELVQNLLKHMLEQKASDLHLSSGELPIIRIDGDLQAVDGAARLTQEDVDAVAKFLIDGCDRTFPSDAFEMDFAYQFGDISRFRVNIFHQYRGTSIAMRPIAINVPTFDELGLPETLRKLCDLPKGLVLITGPTGSGKSTTLAAMLDYVNKTKRKHIITLEDPIEFLHHSRRCLLQQREVGVHTESFGNALRSALREDPDVVLVGEMRDLDTIRLALTAAETGHLVFATLHTASAPQTINRIVDVFPAGEKDMVRSMLSTSLQAAVSQVLVKRTDGGRVAAHEIMICTPAIRNLIREDKVPQMTSAIQTGQAVGMCTLEQSLNALIAEKAIQSEILSEYVKT